MSKILSDTIELQKKTNRSNETGLTEEELFQIASESGIDTNALKETLLNFRSTPEKDAKFSFLKASSRLNHIQVIPGEIDDEIWDEIHVELRSAIGGLGTPKKSGKAYELEQVVEEVGYKHLSLIPKDGNTRLEYTEDWPALKILVLLLSFMITAGISLVALKELGFTKIIFVMLAPIGGLLGMSLSMLGLRAYFNSKKEKLDRIIEVVSKKLQLTSTNSISIDGDLYNSSVDEINNNSISKMKH